MKNFVPKHRNPDKYLKNNKTYWEHDIKPKLGKKKLLDLTSKDFEAIHVSKANAPYCANRMLALASVLCKQIKKERGLVIDLENIEHYPEQPRQRILSESEVDSLKAELILALERKRDGELKENECSVISIA